ncbi:MAG: hypothetical protein DME27_07880 [Verrucomicrobia bacterium]|nr:MAG: hypothetical protein DME27_07880 [Verrucomicrobiota bacterium]
MGRIAAVFKADESESESRYSISEWWLEPKPSWYLVAIEDKMIPPPAQRFMAERAGSTVVEVAGSHAIYVSQPDAVAKLIKTAAEGVTEKAGS